MRLVLFGAAALTLSGCATALPSTSPSAPPASVTPLAEETHLAELRQLTFGGENAEAYWSFDGRQLSFQARAPGAACDRIYRMALGEEPPQPVQVSNGQGATTCAHFLPGDEELVFSSTHLEGAACPPKPDRSMGYVWALYDSYDIYRARADGSNLVRLTTEPGYDAEATVCAKNGSIVYTSVRDGDLELYRMDKDGKNVRRLTHTPGYDGGAFFSADCSKLVWRASRPKAGKELEDYRALLARGLVRPSKLEIFVANADGSDPVQVTYLDAASFAPFFHPNGRRILFSSNAGDPRGREFDLWAVNIDGTQLQRITYAPGFDGFPMFSPDGKWLAFSSNRATAPGAHDTNVFVARWVETPPRADERPPDRLMKDVQWLASAEREGRGIGTKGLEAAGDWLEARFAELGLLPAGDNGFRQFFPVVTSVKVGAATQLRLDGKEVAPDAFVPLGFSASTTVKGALVLAGYGLRDEKLGIDDYAQLDVKGKVVVVRRFVPETEAFADTEKKRRSGDLRHKAWVARERGAAALLVVDWPEPPPNAPKDWQLPPEARLPTPLPEGPGDGGLPVVMVKRAAVEKLWPTLLAKKRASASLSVALEAEKTQAFNVVGRIEAQGEKRAGAVVVGAHYDHLGLGGRDSLAPDKHEPHLGADDNGSGTATLLEIARLLSAQREKLGRDVYVVAFSGEEAGVLGSTHFTRARGDEGMKELFAMLNLDMVGRLRGNKLSVLGSDSAKEWAARIEAACQTARVECSASGDGYGPSDQTPFYAAGVPVLHFFTGAHADYHKPSDEAWKLNAAGMAKVAEIVSALTVEAAHADQLTYQQVAAPEPKGDLRSFNASLGTIPDYSGPPGGQKGVLLAGVRPGGGADLGGLKRGDILVRLGTHSIGSVQDLMYALNAHKPRETVTAVVLREGKEVSLEVTFQEAKRH
ncbi:MAG: M28 family peptidase [Myxococcota bacterium]